MSDLAHHICPSQHAAIRTFESIFYMFTEYKVFLSDRRIVVYTKLGQKVVFSWKDHNRYPDRLRGYRWDYTIVHEGVNLNSDVMDMIRYQSMMGLIIQ